MGPYEDLTFFFFSSRFFVSQAYLGNLDLFRKYNRGKKRKNEKTEVRPRDVTHRTRANFRALFLKNGVDILIYVCKTCEICVFALIT